MKDLLKAPDGDLLIENGDLVIGVSDDQHRVDILTFEKFELKQFPDAGVGVQKFLEAEDEAGLLREISLQYSSDGMDVKQVAIKNGKIIVNAPYK